MSIEKLDSLYIKQERKTFTTHLNSVLQNLNNVEALGIWAYLSSLPESWEVNKAHLRSHFNLGRDKLDKILNYLSDNKLIEIGQLRDDLGKMAKGYILVKCGYEFTKDIHKKDDNKPHTENPLTVKAVSGLAVNGFTVSGKSAPIKEIKSIKEKKREREPTAKASLSIFEPSEQNKALAKEMNLDTDEQTKSFVERCKYEKTQYEFERWLKNAYEYNNKKNVKNTNNQKEDIVRPKYRDFTQERLDREAKECKKSLN